MEKDEIIKIADDATNQPNKKLVDARDILIVEYEKTKEMVISLTRHLDSVEILYKKINEEIGKRVK
jgi:hypothetical protein